MRKLLKAVNQKWKSASCRFLETRRLSGKRLTGGSSAINASMLIGAIVAVLVSGFWSFAEECEQTTESVLRLHIIADSDSDEDQRFKYDLRDRILSVFSAQLSDCDTLEQAKEKAVELLPEIEQEAQLFAISRGYEHDITAQVADMYFTTRVYEDVTMPAGNYTALRITVGSGEGENWWCVMFPPLCLPAVTEKSSEPYFTPAMSEQVENNDKVEVKFALFEFFSKMFNR